MTLADVVGELREPYEMGKGLYLIAQEPFLMGYPKRFTLYYMGPTSGDPGRLCDWAKGRTLNENGRRKAGVFREAYGDPLDPGIIMLAATMHFLYHTTWGYLPDQWERLRLMREWVEGGCTTMRGLAPRWPEAMVALKAAGQIVLPDGSACG